MGASPFSLAVAKLDPEKIMGEVSKNYQDIDERIRAARNRARYSVDGSIEDLRIFRAASLDSGPIFDAIHQKHNKSGLIVDAKTGEQIEAVRGRIETCGCLMEDYRGVSGERIAAAPERSKEGAGWLLIGASVPHPQKSGKRQMVGAAQFMIPPDDDGLAKSVHQYPTSPWLLSHDLMTEMQVNPAKVFRLEDIVVDNDFRRHGIATALRDFGSRAAQTLPRKNLLSIEYGAIASVAGVGRKTPSGTLEKTAAFIPPMTNLPSASMFTKPGGDAGAILGIQEDQLVDIGTLRNDLVDYFIRVHWILIARRLAESKR
jgi:hypothetical protein